ncbi:hypothetical protein UFOVP860_55 [uncultured Caudovirales phage]|uniref:Uncharacterized protein n=1 Tax=uncultured Caudovirales phage TaxID=2100421 RepID=A0A6J5RND4_9CAUD|nr:hypothetical protein UFOVP860_55 [uncultured Caudovirales phage]CAB4195767.1 hypothetical protein UFOVP1293_56 [uncultured Caudovirales phage]CAB4222589.1 hypothetical protein UFOVP1644_74 [uncultured Caudovirales phage]
MTGRELLLLERAAALLASGLASQCREQLEALIRDSGGTPPSSQPPASLTGPGVEARAAA